jgi:membrane protease YdiL (CAAX protease family)
LVVADAEAERSVVLSELLNLIACACILIGILALATLLVRSVFAKRSSTESGSAQQSAASSHADAIGLSIFREMPPRIRDVDRRLGAGDLANLFALYLILMMGVQFIAPLVLRGPLGRYATSASAGAQTAFIIFAEAIVTAFCGCTTVAALFWLAKRRGASVADEIGLNAGAETLTKTVLFGILGWCISLPLVLGTADMASLIFHNAPSPANPAIPLLMATPGGLASIVLYILVAVLAPFFEETVFRGLFYNAARLRVGVWPAIALTGIAFGASHPVGIAEQVPLIVLGATLAWIAQTSKSLLPGMVLHCLQNSFVYALMFFTLLTIVGATPVLQ